MNHKDLIAWINPGEVTHLTTSYQSTCYAFEAVRKLKPNFLFWRLSMNILAVEPFIKPRVLTRIQPIEDNLRYKYLENYIKCNSYQDSLWYEDLVQQLISAGKVRHKALVMSSKDDIGMFFVNYVGSYIFLGPKKRE